MTLNTSPENSTTVRFSWGPHFIAAPLKLAPWLSEPILTRLFLSPVKRVPSHGDRAGAVVGTIRVGQALVKVRARGRGPVVLLVHGWQSSSADLGVLGEALVQKGFTTVAFDMPAHGETPGSVTSLLAFEKAVLGAARLVGPLHGIVAHSLGATAAALALARGLSVRAAVLVAPMISFDFALDEFAKVLDLTPKLREKTAQGVEKRLGVSRKDLNLVHLPAPDAPVLVIHDRDDTRTPILHSEQLLATWKQATLYATHGLGHRRVLRDDKAIGRVVAHLRAAPPPQLGPLAFECAPEMRLD